MNKKLTILVSALLFSMGANAQSSTTTFTANAQLSSACALTATDISFGEYNPTLTDAVTTSGSLSILCTRLTTANIFFSPGNSANYTTYARNLLVGSDTNNKLNYNLYTNSNLQTVWTNGLFFNTARSYVKYVGTSNVTTLPIYASLNAKQYVAPGNYSDSITITVQY